MIAVACKEPVAGGKTGVMVDESLRRRITKLNHLKSYN